MPEDLVSLCFFRQIELADGKCPIGAGSRAPARFGGGLDRFASRQFVPEMDTEDGKQGQSTHIGKQTRERAAAFVGKAGQRRMNLGRIRGGWIGPKRSHQTPKHDRAPKAVSGLTLS